MPDQSSSLPPVPSARAVPRRGVRPSLVWIVPIVAALVGGWVAVTRILSEGPTITITLASAEGLEAGKTKIRYNGVDVGTLMKIRLSDDHQHVVADAQMAPDTDDFLVEDTRFWVVRARISGANVTGLGTLLSGAYLGMEIGHAKEKRRDFVALTAPPVVASDVPGRTFVLKTPTLGSLDMGTPLFFRQVHVGEVVSYHLDDDGRHLTVQVFVKAPFDQYVTPSTRFWQASGIDLSLTASGLSVQTQSLLSILIGGIAFETDPNGPVLPPAPADTEYRLFDNRTDAFKPPARDPQTYLLVFKQSLRGLAPGAPVEFRGIPVGEVVSIGAQIDAKTFDFSAPVIVRLDVESLGIKVVDLPAGEDLDTIRRRFIDDLVARGVRAQLQTGNLLTGSLFVTFDFFPDAPPTTIDWSQKPVRLPTMPGELQAIEASITSIVQKLDKLPLDGVVKDLRKAIDELTLTLASARGTLNNADRLIEPNSLLGAELGNTLQEVSRAARGLSQLADYLERHPEALIRGKTGEPK